MIAMQIGFANKIGGALSTFVVGVLLTMGGYDGSLGVNESASAKSMITFMTGGMPIVMTVVLLVAFSFYTLDKHKEEYEAVVEERRAFFSILSPIPSKQAVYCDKILLVLEGNAL